MIALFFMIFCAYLAAFLPLGEAEASKIFTYLPLLNERALWLKEYHYPSYLPFAAMVGSLVITMPLVVVVFIWGYWKTVVVPRKCKRLHQEAFLCVAFILVAASIFIAIAFVFVPKSYDPRWPGQAGVLFWPWFPALGAGVAWMCSLNLFVALVGLGKAVVQFGGKNG
ncbi:MAG: hypothetical protein U5K75_04585 [Ahrensia sp.]|nr:hypothetical protein [Ahrensia sp.]